MTKHAPYHRRSSIRERFMRRRTLAVGTASLTAGALIVGGLTLGNALDASAETFNLSTSVTFIWSFDSSIHFPTKVDFAKTLKASDLVNDVASGKLSINLKPCAGCFPTGPDTDYIFVYEKGIATAAYSVNKKAPADTVLFDPNASGSSFKLASKQQVELENLKNSDLGLVPNPQLPLDGTQFTDVPLGDSLAKANNPAVRPGSPTDEFIKGFTGEFDNLGAALLKSVQAAYAWARSKDPIGSLMAKPEVKEFLFGYKSIPADVAVQPVLDAVGAFLDGCRTNYANCSGKVTAQVLIAIATEEAGQAIANSLDAVTLAEAQAAGGATYGARSPKTGWDPPAKVPPGFEADGTMPYATSEPVLGQGPGTTTCGPYCLSMVSKSIGHPVDVDTFVKLMATPGAGTDILNIEEMLSKVGIKFQADQSFSPDLVKQRLAATKRPVIVQVNVRAYKADGTPVLTKRGTPANIQHYKIVDKVETVTDAAGTPHEVAYVRDPASNGGAGASYIQLLDSLSSQRESWVISFPE